MKKWITAGLVFLIIGCNSSNKLTGTDYVELSSDFSASPYVIYPLEIADSLGWGEITSSDYDVNEEIRFTLVSDVTPYNMFRLKKGRSTEGESVLYWEKDKKLMVDKPHTDMHGYLKERCHDFFQTKNYEYCLPEYIKEPDWGKVWGNIERSDVWQIPDYTGSVSDSLRFPWQVYIQLRIKDYYRSYSYTNPDIGEQSDTTLNVLSVINQLQTITSMFQYSENFDTYSGVTSGSQNSEFKLCDKSEIWRFAGDLQKLSDESSYPIKINTSDSNIYYVEVKGYVSDSWYTKRESGGFHRVITPSELNELTIVANDRCPGW